METMFKNGVVTLVSGSKAEAIELFLYAQNRQQPKAVVSDKPQAYRKHKKHVFMKECDICGFLARGGTGLSAHRRAHKHVAINMNELVS